MKNKLIVLGVLAALTVTPFASATVIDFDAYANNSSGNGEISGTEYGNLGVEFTTTGIALNIGATVGSAPNSLGADALSVNDFDGDITIQFLDDAYVTDLTFSIFNTPYTASAFDIFGNELITLTGSSFTERFDFSGFEVNRVDIFGDFYAIDDVSFGNLHSIAVPEPSSLALFGLGLAGLGMMRKKRHTMIVSNS